MAHAQKPDFVFRRNGRVHLNRPAGASVQSTTGSRGVRISGSNAGYFMSRGSVKSTGSPLHSPVSPSLPLPCVTVCHHISTSVYFIYTAVKLWAMSSIFSKHLLQTMPLERQVIERCNSTHSRLCWEFDTPLFLCWAAPLAAVSGSKPLFS